MWAKRERLGSSLTTGLKPLPHFRLKAELRRVDIGRTCWVGVPALAASLRGTSWLQGHVSIAPSEAHERRIVSKVNDR